MKTTMTSTIFLLIAAVLTLSVAAAYAQESVKMTFSGTSANSAVNLQQPNTSNDEDNWAGSGTLGSFTFRNVRAISNIPGSSSTCSGTSEVYFPDPAGAGVFRFEDSSLLYVSLTQGGDCVDFAADVGHCTATLQITGGTGRFKNASGTLTFTETSVPVLTDAMNNPVYFAATGGVRERFPEPARSTAKAKSTRYKRYLLVTLLTAGSWRSGLRIGDSGGLWGVRRHVFQLRILVRENGMNRRNADWNGPFKSN